jgi:hypothetical protein
MHVLKEVDMELLLDQVANILDIPDLPRNTKPIRLRSFASLALMFAPGIGFPAALWLLQGLSPRFTWVSDVAQYPWQLWAIGALGIIASLGGAGDWLYHKVYVTVGPREHHSHMLALGAGGLVFVLMAAASLLSQPAPLLIPIIIALLLTTALICYDEFAFHIRRCKPFETLLHRMLVFGNGLAFLCWVHWVFVVGI